MDPNAMLAAMAAIPGVTLVNPGAPAGVAAVPGAPLDPNAPNPATKKAREIYVGNLAVGILTAELTREMFNKVLSPFCHDPVNFPPVVECKLDLTTGRFAFLEIRTEQLAANLLELDKMEVAGKTLKIGRPKGYEEQFGKQMVTAKLNLAQTFAAQV
jgi:splicing factor U2AF subunit